MLISIVLLIISIIAILHSDRFPIYKKRPLTDLIKFIASLLVVNDHIFLFGQGGDGKWTYEFNIGPLCVSVFLFLSGYGIMSSYKHKGEVYLKNFLRHRLIRTILPLLTAYIITIPIYRFVVGPFNWNIIFTTILWGGPILRFSWFVSEITILYILFYVCMRLPFGLNAKLTIITTITIVLICVMTIFNQPIWYLESVPAFIIGLWYQKNEDKIINFKFGRITTILIVLASSIILLISFRWSTFTELTNILTAWRYQYASYFVMNIAAIVLLIILLTNLPSQQNSLNIYKIYYEIYLLQHCAMIIAGAMNLQFSLYWSLTMIITLILALILHKINNFIIKASRL